MNLIDYISERLELASKHLNSLDENDIETLVDFTEHLLDPNYILDAFKGINRKKSRYWEFKDPKINKLVTEITSMVNAVTLKKTDIVKTVGMVDPTSSQRMRIAIETLLSEIKNKPKDKQDKLVLGMYIDQGNTFGQKLEVAHELTYGSENDNVYLLYIMNIIDMYFAKLLKSEREKISIGMNGVFSGNIKRFIQHLVNLVKPKGEQIPKRFETLVGNFVSFAEQKKDYTIWGGKNENKTTKIESDNKISIIPNIPLTMVEIPDDATIHDFINMAHQGYIPVYHGLNGIIANNNEAYDPDYIFRERKFHDTLALALLQDPELSLYNWASDKKECRRVVIDYIVMKYPELGKIKTRTERISLESPDPSRIDVLEVETFFDLLRLYNLYQKYKIIPETPSIIASEDKFLDWQTLSSWVLSLKDKAELANQDSIEAYPFIREYKTSGGFVPDVSLKDYKSPVKAWELIQKNTDVHGGFYSDNNPGEIVKGSYKVTGGYITEPVHISTNNTGDIYQSTNICKLDPSEATRYICYAIFGFILSRNYADYNLYYDLQKKRYFGGAIKVGKLDDSNYSINRNYKMLYRDIIILGSWYFKKIDDQRFITAIEKFSGRWSTINKIFFSLQGTGGVFLVPDINTIVFKINQIISEFIDNSDNEDTIQQVTKQIIDDFIDTFHLTLKAYVEFVLDKDNEIPLELDVASVTTKYEKTIKAYSPVIYLDSAIMERYNLDDVMLEKIYKIKNRYLSDLRISENATSGISEGDVRILMESLNYNIRSQNYDNMAVKMIEAIGYMNQYGSIFFPKFDMLYYKITGNRLDKSNIFSPTDPISANKLNKFVKAIDSKSTPNASIRDGNDKKLFELMINKQVYLHTLPDSNYINIIEREIIDTIRKIKNHDLVEREVNDFRTVLTEIVGDKYEGVINSSTEPMVNIVDMYNTIVSGMFNKNIISEYIAIKYNPKRMSKVPEYIYRLIELIYCNYLYIGYYDQNSDTTLGKVISYPEEKSNENEYLRDNGSIGDKILFNEVVLINSRINVVRITDFFELPPLYIFNTYFNYFVNFSRTRTTPREQVAGHDIENFIELSFNIFRDGYIDSMDTKVPLG